MWDIVRLVANALSDKNIQWRHEAPQEKPAPDMYLHALQDINTAWNIYSQTKDTLDAVPKVIIPSRCLVIEDSEVGLSAAKDAGMKCAVTPSYYTQKEDFSRADWVLNSLDDIFS